MSTLLELFDSLSRNYGEHDAVTSSMSSWCYAEISQASDALAAQLVHRFGKPPILLMDLNRNAAAELATVIACMRLGILFCPVDGTDPIRLTQIVQVLRKGRVRHNENNHASTPIPNIAAVVLASNDRDPRLTSFYQAGIHFCVLLNAAGDMVEPMAVPSSLPTLSNHDDDLYILFTSGTTSAEPKAVVGSHYHTLRRLRWFVDEVHEGDDPVVIARRTPLVFVDGIHELLSVLLHDTPPAKLFCSEALVDLVQHSTRVSMLPSQLAQTLESTGYHATKQTNERSSLDVIVVSGEPCPCSVVTKFQASVFFSKTRLFNFYGQTETVGDICYSNLSVDKVVQSTVPVGRLLPGVELKLIEGTNEVVVTHGSFANGYYNSPVALCPFSTGDQGFYDVDCLYIRGRIGDVQKVNGILTSPTEVETRFQSVFGNCHCAATIICGASYILSEQDSATSFFTRDKMREANVPWNLIPKEVFAIHSLPRTNSGKVHRVKVKEIVEGRVALDSKGTTVSKARSPILQAICQVLNIPWDRIGSRSQCSFVELGGDSLLAVALWHKLRALEILDKSSPVQPLDLLWARDTNELQSIVESGPDAKRRRTERPAATPTFTPLPSEKVDDNHFIVRFPGCVDATPLLFDGCVYGACQSGVVQRMESRAFTATSPTAITIGDEWRIQSSLISCYNTIIACCHHESATFGLVVCLNKELTTTIWRKQLPSAIKATPRVQSDRILIASGDVLFALDRKNGATVAQIPLAGVSECCPVTLSSEHSTDNLYLFSDWSCGCEVVTFEDDAFVSANIGGLDAPVRADPLLLESNKVLAADVLGFVHVIDVLAKAVTSTKVSSTAFFSAPVMTSKGDIVLGCNDGIVRCLRHDDPSVIRWTLDMGAAVVTKVLSTREGKLFVCTTAGQVLSVSVVGGSPAVDKKIAVVNGEIWGAPLLADLGSNNATRESKTQGATEVALFGARDACLHVIYVS